MKTIDKESKQLVIDYFKNNISVDCYDFDEVDQYHYVDLSCEISGKRVAIEVKEREYTSNTFGDILIEKQKVDKANKDENFDSVLAINIYKDNVLAISNIKNGKSKWLKCPVTSCFNRREYVWKECWIMPQSHKIRILENEKFVKIQ